MNHLKICRKLTLYKKQLPYIDGKNVAVDQELANSLTTCRITLCKFKAKFVEGDLSSTQLTIYFPVSQMILESRILFINAGFHK